MNRRRKKLLAFSAIALAGLAATACSSSSSSSSAPTAAAAAASGSASPSSSVNLSSVTLNVGDQKGTGAEAILKAAGLLNTLPFHVNWSDFTSGPPMLEAMASGSVDVGGVGDAPPVFAAAGGEGVVIVGARTVPTGDQDAVVVPKGSTITSIQQLKGKKIAYGSGSSGNYEPADRAHGGRADHQGRHDGEPAAGRRAGGLHLRLGRRLGHLAALRPAGRRPGRRQGAGPGSQYGSPYSYEVASKSAVANPEKAAAIQVYLATLDKAYVWAEKNPDAWGAAWAAATGLPASITDVAATVDSTTPVVVNSAVTTSEQDLVTQFYKAGPDPERAEHVRIRHDPVQRVGQRRLTARPGARPECRWGRVEVDAQAVAAFTRSARSHLDDPMPIEQALTPDDLSAMQILSGARRVAADRLPAGGRSPLQQPTGFADPDDDAGGRVDQAADGGQAWPRQFAVLLAEALTGDRPVRQIRPWLSQRGSVHLHRLLPLFGDGQRARVQRVMTTQPTPDVIEMTLIVAVGPRIRALAVRLALAPAEQRPGWREKLPSARAGAAGGHVAALALHRHRGGLAAARPGAPGRPSVTPLGPPGPAVAALELATGAARAHVVATDAGVGVERGVTVRLHAAAIGRGGVLELARTTRLEPGRRHHVGTGRLGGRGLRRVGYGRPEILGRG